LSTLFFIFDAVKINWIYRFVKYLKKVYFKNDKRVAAYLVCVAIATGFWFLNALGKIYTVDILAPVSYVNFPNNKTLANQPPDQFELTIRAHGFTILRHKLSFLFMPLEFNVNELTNNRMTDNRKSNFTFPSKFFLSELSYQLSNDIEILSMNPDTLFFRFDKLGHKHIKVKPVVQINLKKQYQISGNIKTNPDSVTVSGPQVIIDTIKFAYTEINPFKNADQNIQTEAIIRPVRELFFEPQQVNMEIPVEEYTEAEQLVPVLIVNQPENVNVKLFPSKVKVSYLVGLSRFSEIHAEDFKLSVSYNDIKDGNQRLKIVSESAPPFLYGIKILPEELEYLIESDIPQ
jgi:hypothetical protein